jgi:hypothetical protein
MKSLHLILASLLVATHPLAAQGQNSELITVGADKFLRWHGQADRTYFIQVSDPNDHLRKWTWAPIIESGNDEDISYEVDGTADKGFFRLWFSDQLTDDPDGDDFDYDGLTNWDEVNTHQTNPLKWDSDDDGLPDWWEIEHGLNPNDDGSGNPANGASGDPDGEGLTNEFEYWYYADPNLADTDSDGLNDFDEVWVYYTYPDSSDTDWDGLDDHAEIFTHGTDPSNWDTDEDTLSDGEEVVTHGTNPLEMDTDGDWMWDDYEIANNLNPTDAADGLLDADNDTLANQLEFVFLDKGYDPFTASNAAAFPWAADPDWDGITTQAEFVIHLTNPRQNDTDLDGMDDSWEIAHGFNAKVNNLNAGPANQRPDADPDGDGLTNAEESGIGTSPNNPDTDSDSVTDMVENDQGSNPNDPDDNLPPPNGTSPVNVTFDDPSGSHSEKYRVQFTPLEGENTGHGVRFRTNQSYGVLRTATLRMPKGSKYQVELIHLGTSPRYRGTPKPDYDYTLEIDTTQGFLVVADPDGIMGDESGNETFTSEGKSATLHVPLFEWVTPKGSPVTAPNDTPNTDGRNEFTYDAAAPGVLTIDLKVEVKPSGTAGLTGHDGVKFSDRCKYVLPNIAGSNFVWDPANHGGKSNAVGEHLLAKATYTTLPGLNSEFGLKEAEFTCDSETDVLPQAEFEVFYMKNATNHPEIGPYAGPRPPNWYYYWKNALGYADIEYHGGGPLYGEAPGMLRWSYLVAPRKDVVYIYDLASMVDPGDPDADHGLRQTTGIDVFIDTVLHEKKHVVQIDLADTLVTMTAGTPWQHGWSWNQPDHNHWSVGSDGLPGIGNVDDDGDSMVDNLTPSGAGELGFGDDGRLDDGTADRWPSSLGAKPPPPWAGGSAIEDQAYNVEPDDENAQAALDWGNPGKQHKTLNKYND